MRFTDMLLVLPELPLLLVLIRVVGPSIWNLIIIIGFLGWMGFARVVRSQVLSLKERPFVEAAKALGSGKLHIVGRHILPNVMNLVYVTLAMSVPGAIMAEAYLSFLGLYDPHVMTWGRMLDEALAEAGGAQRWWWVLPPGLCIGVISVSFILIGYALDEILNPKLRERR
jgi:peptide/nickel transport system permease protein